jgi:hypothetical protein
VVVVSSAATAPSALGFGTSGLLLVVVVAAAAAASEGGLRHITYSRFVALVQVWRREREGVFND